LGWRLAGFENKKKESRGITDSKKVRSIGGGGGRGKVPMSYTEKSRGGGKITWKDIAERGGKKEKL